MRAEKAISPSLVAERPYQKTEARSSVIGRLFGGGLTIMADDKPETKLSIPYPILAVIVTALLWVSGMTIGGVYAFATVSANVSALNNAMLIRDAQYAREREEMDRRHRETIDEMKRKQEIQDAYITTTREDVARLGETGPFQDLPGRIVLTPHQ